MPDEQTILQSLREFIDHIWLIDTHEHVIKEEEWVKLPDGACDFSHFFPHYASTDVVSAGCPTGDWQRIQSHDTPLEEKWSLFEPYWEKAKFTGYGRAVRLAMRDLFDVPDLNRDTYRELSRRMADKRKTGWYKSVLKDRARIEKSLLNTSDARPDPELFVPVVPIDDFIMVSSVDQLRALESRAEMSIHSVDDLAGAMEKVFRIWLDSGAVATKVGVAYRRTLAFDRPSKASAEMTFSRLFARNGASFASLTVSEGKPLQDYLLHRILQITFDAGLPVQIHTGIQEGNGNYLDNSNPLHLSNLFMVYPKGRFDIFHAGYPFTSELGVLAKMFPGVHADLCWMHIVSPAAARRALDEWLETVPASKIFGFGGDYLFVEGAYAHAKMARENVARVLAAKVAEDYMTEDEARTVAQMLLRENAKEFFRL